MRNSLSKYLTVKTSKACVTETRQAPMKEEVGGRGGGGRIKPLRRRRRRRHRALMMNALFARLSWFSDKNPLEQK